MRRGLSTLETLLGIAVVALLAFVMWKQFRPAPGTLRGKKTNPTNTVTVTANCNQNPASLVVDPWVVALDSSRATVESTIYWDVKGIGGTIEILARSGRKSALVGANGPTIPAGKLDSAKIRKGAFGRYPYDIRLTCSGTSGFTIMIDPDIIVVSNYDEVGDAIEANTYSNK